MMQRLLASVFRQCQMLKEDFVQKSFTDIFHCQKLKYLFFTQAAQLLKHITTLRCNQR